MLEKNVPITDSLRSMCRKVSEGFACASGLVRSEPSGFNTLNDVRRVTVGGVGDYQCLVLEIFEIVHKSIGLNCETIKLIAVRR